MLIVYEGHHPDHVQDNRAQIHLIDFARTSTPLDKDTKPYGTAEGGERVALTETAVVASQQPHAHTHTHTPTPGHSQASEETIKDASAVPAAQAPEPAQGACAGTAPRRWPSFLWLRRRQPAPPG